MKTTKLAKLIAQSRSHAAHAHNEALMAHSEAREAVAAQSSRTLTDEQMTQRFRDCLAQCNCADNLASYYWEDGEPWCSGRPVEYFPMESLQNALALLRSRP